ncbi:MAG: DUF2520 domain-containing protein [Dehalococcoidia bacterium]|nr:DUF2520 domain-containing protein [Dehalococcoidia bacterium]
MSKGEIGIIGAGRLGASLAAAIAARGYRLTAIASRSEVSARALAAQLGDGALVLNARALVAACELVFLTVPDGELEGLASSLPWRAGRAVVHCSGALGLDVLAPAVARGAVAGCLHPLQTFPTRSGDATRFHGITCGVEAPEPLGARLEAIARALGAEPVRLEGVDRALYHAAAVFASNYVVALAAAAARGWALAGLPPDRARVALATLTANAARDVGERELRDALTGPIARGDVGTVARHLDALAREPGLRELYRRLGRELLALEPSPSPDAVARLRALLGAVEGEGAAGEA